MGTLQEISNPLTLLTVLSSYLYKFVKKILGKIILVLFPLAATIKQFSDKFQLTGSLAEEMLTKKERLFWQIFALF